MASRIPLRLIRRRVGRVASKRSFTTASSFLEAQNFTMPAMSPTMTEGNISSWKVKEGDSFSAGDVLLDVETDKATMDVEAQDDGVVARIIQVDGAKNIQVGSRIAVLAEPDDDISSIEIPPDESKAAAEPNDASKGSPAESADSPTPSKSEASSSKPPSGTGQNNKYPLYPAVSALLRENHVPESKIAQIPATGPNGRLLKGDVLSFLGRIGADYSSAQSKRIQHLAHLDLSNIKKTTQVETKAQPEAASPAQSAPADPPAATQISLPISLAEVLKVQQRMKETLNTSIPLSTFLARAIDHANDDLPRPQNMTASQDELFNAILGLNPLPRTSRGDYVPQLTALPGSPSPITNTTATASRSVAPATKAKPSKKTSDIIDILTGQISPTSRPSSYAILEDTSHKTTSASAAAATSMATGPAAGGAINHFSITVRVGEERRARTFLERVKTVLQVEPGRLVL